MSNYLDKQKRNKSCNSLFNFNRLIQNNSGRVTYGNPLSQLYKKISVKNDQIPSSSLNRLTHSSSQIAGSQRQKVFLPHPNQQQSMVINKSYDIRQQRTVLPTLKKIRTRGNTVSFMGLKDRSIFQSKPTLKALPAGRKKVKLMPFKNPIGSSEQLISRTGIENNGELFGESKNDTSIIVNDKNRTRTSKRSRSRTIKIMKRDINKVFRKNVAKKILKSQLKFSQLTYFKSTFKSEISQENDSDSGPGLHRTAMETIYYFLNSQPKCPRPVKHFDSFCPKFRSDYNPKKPILVLDMDETLVHTKFNNHRNDADIVVTTSNGSLCYVRPDKNNLLRWMYY